MTQMDSLAEAAKLKFIPAITVSERYDDNIFFEESDIDDDHITEVAPQLTASYNAKAVNMKTVLVARAEFFGEHTELNNYQYRANFKLDIDEFMKNTSLSVSDVFHFTPEPPDFLAGEVEEEEITTGGIRIRRGDSLRNSASARLIQKLSTRTDARIEYTNKTSTFEDPSLVDSTSHNAEAGLGRRIGPRDTLNIGYEYLLFLPEEGEKSESHNASIGLDHQFTPTFSTDVAIGTTYVIRDPDDAYVVSGSLRVLRKFKRTRLSLGYSRSINTTTGLSREPTTSQVASIRMYRDLTRNLAINLSQNYATNRSTISDDIDLQSWQTRVGLTIALSSWLKGEVEYRHFTQNSDGLLGREFKRNQAFVRLNAYLP
jgi:hypothetical protein